MSGAPQLGLQGAQGLTGVALGTQPCLPSPSSPSPPAPAQGLALSGAAAGLQHHGAVHALGACVTTWVSSSGLSWASPRSHTPRQPPGLAPTHRPTVLRQGGTGGQHRHGGEWGGQWSHSTPAQDSRSEVVGGLGAGAAGWRHRCGQSRTGRGQGWQEGKGGRGRSSSYQATQWLTLPFTSCYG